MKPTEIPSDRVARGEWTAPPSKSVTHRALLLAMLSRRPIVLERPLIATDTDRLIDAIRACGGLVELGESELGFQPGAPPEDLVRIDCGASGTLLRLLIGVLAVTPGRWVLDGTSRLRQRPVGPLVEALVGLDARVRCPRADGLAPVEIQGGGLAGGRTRLDAGLSSQFLSALILAALRATEPVEIEVGRLSSAPYVDLTLDYVRRFGGRAKVDGNLYQVQPGLGSPGRLRIEGDYSSSAYFAAAAALTGGEIRMLGLDAASAQGDRGFLGVLERMGATIEVRETAVQVTGGRGLTAVDVDMGGMPDQVPTLAALAPFARGSTRIRGVAALRLKESDRLAAMARELGRLGATVVETAGELEIPGVWAECPPPTGPVLVDSHDDHRIAMSLAVHGLRRPGLRIAAPQVVDKSYPGFWVALDRMLSR